jgi:hypothetical protein
MAAFSRGWWYAALSLALCPAWSDSALAFNYANFSSTAGLNVVSSAAQSSNDIRLSPSSPSTAGAIWFGTKQSVENGFDTTFDFRITGVSGTTDFNGQPGGDGIAFVVQNASATALGLTNSYMGYEIANSLAAEFDVFRNGNFLSQEPSGNHVGVQSNGTAVNDPFAGAYLGAAAVVPDMSNGSVHTGRVLYVPGSLKMFVDDLVNPELTISVNLSTLLSLDSGTAYVGFTAGGAAAYENHDLLNWNFTSVPEPTSLVTLLIGTLFVGARRRIYPRPV